MTAHTAEPGRARLLVPQLGAASSPPHLVKDHRTLSRSRTPACNANRANPRPARQIPSPRLPRPSYGLLVYVYTGPPELLAHVRPDVMGAPITSSADIEGLAPDDEPFTYIVDLKGTLRVAPRRSEHVACAGGRPVLAAGEIAFERVHGEWVVTEVSNQSTGYCPDPASWPEVAGALDRAGIARPDGFTAAFVFRRCGGCGELNVVKDEHYVCVFCEGGLSGI